MNPPAALTASDLHAFRGERHVLRGVSLTARAGELLHVRGPNGAGKTTLLKILTGLMRPEQGEVRWQGALIHQAAEAYQRSLAYASHEPALKGDLSALENLSFAVGLKRACKPEELMQILEQVGVADCAHLPARVLSAGQRRRVAMARILGVRASLWLLDEPFTNLDSAGSALLLQLLEAHVKGGGSAVVVAHHELTVNVPLNRLELSP